MNTFKAFSKEHFLYLKAIAILAVIVGHVGNFTEKTWFTPLGGIGVAIFLFCSGFGLSESYQKQGLHRFWRKKLLGVYLPYFVVEVIAGIVCRRSILDIVLGLVFVKRSHPYGWYMQYLIVCYLLFWLAYKWIPHQTARLILFGVCSLASFVLLPNLQGEQAISFLAGILFSVHGKSRLIPKDRALPVSKWVLWGIGLLIVSAVLLALKQLPVVRTQHHYVITLLNLLLKSSFAAGVIAITSVFAPFAKWVGFVGVISYELYLLHGYSLSFIGENVFGTFLLSALGFLAITFACSAIFHLLLKFPSAIQHKRKASEESKA